MIVADASAIVELLLGGERGLDVAELFVRERDRVQAPGLVDVEVAQALRRMVQTGALTASRGRAAVEILQAMPLERHQVSPLLPRIWGLKDALTAYDATYVALAEALECPLVTFDQKLARGARRVSATRVVVL